MKKKNPLLILLAALAALALVYIGVSALKKNSEQKKIDAEDAELSVTTYDGASAITLRSSESELGFTYTDTDGWRSAQQPDWPIDQNALKTLESQLAGLKAVRALAEHGSLADYGLDEPMWTVSVTDSDGAGHELYIGDLDANGNYYARTGEDDRVFCIAAALPDSLDKGILDYVAYTQLPQPDQSAVYSITLEQGGDSYEYSRSQVASEGSEASAAGDAADAASGDSAAEPEYVWTLSKNGEVGEASTENVGTAIYDVVSLSLSSCVAYEPDETADAIYGLVEPAAAITVKYAENGEDKSYKLYIGNSFGDGESAYVRMEGDGAVTACPYNTGLSEAITLLRSA